jgi:CHAT domain-containing protein/tetratricopeptide (TPR) repeat protein
MGKDWPVMLVALALSSITGIADPAVLWAQEQSPQTQAGTDRLAEARKLGEQADALLKAGQYPQALELTRQALALQVKILGQSDPAVASSLRQLARLHWMLTEYREGEPLAVQALAIHEQVYGQEHLEVAEDLEVLTNLYRERGDYPGAERFCRRALAIWEKLSGLEHPNVARGLNALAILYATRADYAQAEPLYRRALAIREKAFGAEHPETAKVLNNLALMHMKQGSYDRAEPLLRRTLAAWEKTYGPEHPNAGIVLLNLAAVLSGAGRLEEVEPLLLRDLAIWEKITGPDSLEVARPLNNLAELYVAQGKYEQAKPLHQRSVSILEKILGPEHPDVALGLLGLAVLHSRLSEYDRAEPLYRRALEIRTRVLGPRHPLVGETQFNWALMAVDQGQLPVAFERLYQAIDIEEANVALNLALASEGRRRSYLAGLQKTTDLALGLHLQKAPDDRDAARLALGTLLRRKGRLIDVLSEDLDSLRRRLNAGDQQLFNELADARRQLATLVFRGLGTDPPDQYQGRIQALARQIDVLEGRLAERSSLFRSQQQSAASSVEAIAHRLPADATLVELAVYRPVAPGAAAALRFDAPRYVAYLLSGEGSVQAVDLGEVAPIDRLVRPLHQFLRDPRSPIALQRRTAHQLYRRLMRPILDRLPAGTRHLLISPDGALHLIPFAALVDEDNHYLIENFTLSYLGSGRDLLRLDVAQVASRRAPLILANPDYRRVNTEIARAPARTTRALPVLRSVDLARLPPLSPLPGTGEEARKLARLLPGARVLTGAQATENTLKRTRAPRILHLATHGFFLDEVTISGQAPPAVVSENPLLRSGLALAGFDRRTSGDEDGVLTALEVSSLDLQGTALVVLSACDTGVGQVQTGEGVYGLRRAFTLAGAQSQLVSLWKVEDRATLGLMEEYYRALKAGLGRSEALRRAQLTLRSKRGLEHPFFWAGFIPSGDWRPLPKR